MAILTRDTILQAKDLQTELIPVPEWGGEVYVRGMTGSERDKFEAGLITQRGNSRELNMQNARAKLCAMCICDADGKRLFTEEDVKALGGKSAQALQRIFAVAQRLSGIGADDVKVLTEGVTEAPFDASASDLQDI